MTDTLHLEPLVSHRLRWDPHAGGRRDALRWAREAVTITRRAHPELAADTEAVAYLLDHASPAST